jgi:NodT family efflux transporter outer membrane factor (OMF) lipoprotein
MLFFSACTKEFENPSLPFNATMPFSSSGDAEPAEKWWTSFGDAALNELVDQALHDNFSLKSAWQRLRASRAEVVRASSGLFPSLDALGELEIGNDESRQNPQFLLGLSAEYEVDLWGRIGQAIEAEEFRAAASFADYKTAALSLSAETTLAWFQLLEAQSRKDLLEEQQDANTKILQLIKIRFGTGLIGSVDILRQEQLIEENKQQIIRVDSDIKVIKHRLAVLTGRLPQEGLLYEHAVLPDVPPLPATGLPPELTRRRPDIQRAFNLLAAADRDMAAAVSDQYPRLTLTGSLSTQNDDNIDILEQWTRSLAAGLLAPLFDGKRRSAEVERTKAVKQERLYEYASTILEAFREVEDALIQESKQGLELQSLSEQLRLAQKALERIEFEYLNGVRDYIDVLTTLRDEQQLRRDLISAKLRLLEFRIALYRALAGGFDTPFEAAPPS